MLPPKTEFYFKVSCSVIPIINGNGLPLEENCGKTLTFHKPDFYTHTQQLLK